MPVPASGHGRGIEPLEARVLWHGGVDHGADGHHAPVGAVVPWANPPISYIVISPQEPPDLPSRPPPPAAPPPPPPAAPPPVSSAPPAGELTEIQWSTAPGSPIVRAEAMRGVYDDRLYLFGGFSGKLGPVAESHYYNSLTREWNPVSRLPELITHAGVAQTASDVYFVGGYVGTGRGYQQVFGSTRVWKYNFQSDSYARLADLPQPLAGGGAAVLGGKLHYFGGSTLDRQDAAIHLVLDLSIPGAAWQSAPSLPTARNHLGHAVVADRIYAIAGQTGNDEGLSTLRTVQMFDPATQTWEARADIPRGLSHISASVVVVGEQIVVLGGETAHNAQSRKVWSFNTQTNTWKQLTPLPAARFSGVAGLVNGQLVFATGGGASTTWEGRITTN